jgi:hypothetical protein
LATSIHTWEQFMCKFLHAFENYDFDNLCAKILEIKKNEDESLKDFVIIFTHLCCRFPLDDNPSNNDLISSLVSLINETNKSMDEKSKSCFNLSSHANLDLNEHVENVNGLDGLHMFGSFFTMGDTNQIENYFSEKSYVSSHHCIPPFFLYDEKETSCVVNSSSYFCVASQEEDFPVDNGTLRVTPMVMSSSHYPLSSFPSQQMEEGAMEKKLKVGHFVNEETLDTLKMNPSSHMDNSKLIYDDLDCPDILNSSSSSDIEQDFFVLTIGHLLKPLVLMILMTCFSLLTMNMLWKIFQILIWCRSKTTMLFFSLQEKK